MIEDAMPAVYSDNEPPEAVVTPPREGRATDASRLMFPWPIVAAIVGTAVAVVGGQYASNASIRDQQQSISSDIRDMRTRMEMQTQIDIARNEARTAELASQNEAINELKRLTQLLQLQYSTLEKKVK